MEKDIRNIDVVFHKLELPLMMTTNYRLEVARKEKRKKKDMIKKQKTKAMVTICQRIRGKISLSNK